MSPDQVRSIIECNFPMLISEDRNGPDGYSFFLGAPRRGSDSNRIIRVVQRSENGPVQLKFSISSRIEGKGKEISFDGDEESLVKLVGLEIKLYEERFGKA